MKRERARANLTRRVDQLEKKAGVHKCATCRDWAGVIHMKTTTGGLVEKWGPWEGLDGHRCPTCGRQPQVITVLMKYDLLAEPGYMGRSRLKLPPG